MLWTDEAIEVLKRLAQEGRSASAIATALGGASRNAVIGKATRIGVRLNSDKRAPASGSAPQDARRPPSATRLRSHSPSRRRQATTTEQRFTEAEVGEMRRVTLADIRPFACRWPLGDPAAGDFAYCGLASAAGRPYCAGHCRMAYRPPAARRSGRDRAEGARANAMAELGSAIAVTAPQRPFAPPSSPRRGREREAEEGARLLGDRPPP